MKALTLWQPWATLVATGYKPYETRSWPTPYRGPLAIHSSATMPTDDRSLQARLEIRRYIVTHGWPPLPPNVFGAIIAVADLIACIPSEDQEWPTWDRLVGDLGPGRYAWHLANVRPLCKPIPCGGWQRLWNPPLIPESAISKDAVIFPPSACVNVR